MDIIIKWRRSTLNKLCSCLKQMLVWFGDCTQKLWSRQTHSRESFKAKAIKPTKANETKVQKYHTHTRTHKVISVQKEKEKIEMKNLANMGSGVSASVDENDDEDISKSAFASFQAREEEIEKMKMQVKEKVEMKLGQAEEQTRRLAQVWEVSPTKTL